MISCTRLRLLITQFLNGGFLLRSKDKILMVCAEISALLLVSEDLLLK